MILGIDPGSHRTGWAVLARREGRLRHVACGVLRPGGDDLGSRLVAIHAGLAEVIRAHGPREAALEDVFHHANARSAFVLGQARGVALLAVAEGGLPPAFYAPAMVKRVVAGSGRADKAQVARVIAAMLGLDALPPADAADALAIAACHALAGGMRQVIGSAR